MSASTIVVYSSTRSSDALITALRAATSREIVSCQDASACLRALPDAGVLFINGAAYDVAIARAVSAAASLRWIQFLSSGTDRLLRYGGARPDVTVTNAAEAIGPAVAEHAMALALGLVRALPALEAAKRARLWQRDAVTARLSSLDGASVTVLGYGAIGRAIVERARAFGAQCTVVRRTPSAAQASPGVRFEELDDALAHADMLFVALPLTAQTKGLLDRRRIRLLPASGYVVNVARSAVLDTVAVVDALREGRLAGVAFDVFDEEPLPGSSPLWQVENLVISPHVAGLGSRRTVQRIADICVRNLRAFEAGTLTGLEGHSHR